MTGSTWAQSRSVSWVQDATPTLFDAVNPEDVEVEISSLVSP